MTKNFTDILYLYSCAIRGVVPNADKTYDFRSIYTIACSQGIWEIVFLSVKKMFQQDSSVLKQEVYDSFYKSFLIRYGNQNNRYCGIHVVINNLKEAGIECCVLKGECVAQYYNIPLARVSRDIDILIKKDDLERCTELLVQNGFTIIETEAEIHHVSFTHPKIGLLEVHTEMYDFQTKEISLNNMITYDEDYVTFIAEDGTELKTLGYTDNFIFLYMHYLKHFLYTGAGIRQMSDVLLYVENNYSRINWEMVKNILDALSFYNCFLHLIAIGERYFEFPKGLFDTSSVKDELIEKILTDIEKGGMWGKCDQGRNGFIDAFLEKRHAKFHPDSKEKPMLKRKKRFFPNRSYMSINYKYVNKSALLLPVAWVNRFIDVILRKRKEKPVHNERLELLRELDII